VIVSDDKTSELTLSLADDLEFGYGEPHKQDLEDVRDFVCGLVVFLPAAPRRRTGKDKLF
jgi:hypothetical protein